MRIKKESKRSIRSAISQFNLGVDYGDHSSGSMGKIEDGEKMIGGFVVKEGNDVLGWGVAWEDEEFHLYVLPKHREKGIGSKICQRAKKHFPEHKFCPWNYKLKKFFKKNEVKIHKEWGGE